jgi:murein DD-endopeptidase MepM/ murein hydrolase activator NlpD
VANLKTTTPQQIDQLKQDLTGAQGELDGILKDNTDRQNKLISDLGANQQLIDQTDGQFQATSQQLDYTQTQVDTLQRQLDQLNLDIAATKQQLNVFLRFTYKEERRSLLEYLLEATSFGDFITRIGGLQAIDSQQDHLLTLSKDQQQQLASTQTELSGQLQQLHDLQAAQQLQQQTLALQRQDQQQLLEQARVEAQEATDRITAKEDELQAAMNQKQAEFDNSQQLLQNLQSARAQLASTIDNQAGALTKAQQQAQAAQTQLDQIEREEESIAAVIRQANPTHTYASGHVAWPIHGLMEQGFGPSPYKFEAPITYQGVRYAHFHTGIDIAAPNGTPIGAAADGQVITTGFDPYGYGNYIILAHSPKLATLYGHMSRLAVAKGAVVKQGQTIGYEGSTGNSTGPHLHFEVRVDGNFVNPLGYL